MSRRVTETMPRRDEVPLQRAQRRVAATLTFPLEAGEGSIEMPRQTETPEGASVAPVGGFAKRVSPCQPSPSAFTSTRPPIQSPASRSQEGSAKTGEPTAANRAAVKITALTREARDELEALRNISREVKTSVCEKLQRIAALALSLEESRSHHILEVEREKTKRARDLEAAEKRLQKTTEHHLDRCLRVETAVANMAAEIKRTQDAIDRMDIPNKLEGLRKTLEIKPTTYAAAAAKPKLQAAAKPQVPGPKIAAAHTLIVSSRCANHTSDQVVKAIREVVLTCVSDDAIKRIETRIKTKSKDLQVSKPEPSLPLIIIRDVLKVNSDAQIVESLKRQNGHTTEGLDWGKVEARVRYRRRARNPRVPSGPRCRPRYTSQKPATCMGVAAATGLGPVASCSARAVLVSAIRNGAENKMTSARTVEAIIQVPRVQTAKLLNPKVHKLHESRLRGRRPFGT
ncbi:hypothetical protein EVAR_9230_1 [Eumeta japonica]|uniref:Uncharacterized protein n=1 Tax=Eumeta variegata TaxID=151549 RepID=A0A4C2ACR5_EUMVA|nr:hypothetical protein EVAR_9230_1 [Eumeta japonica]